MIIRVSQEDKESYIQAYNRVASDLEASQRQFEELRCRIYALKQAEMGLGILVGKFDVSYYEASKQFLVASLNVNLPT